ncbi:hypothetical protein BCR42DRAFT_487925 [Absidia repens]|uniref:Uncharacterized protein n=1 Tax=Absidia repens TaxID=90262 RepID=A0A1X2IUA1_9FUNG|nr:hypothetical protein BCR42DRAFT_487925 [Absidia repens]
MVSSSSSSTLLFESGIMKIFDYDPIHDRYLTRTLELPSLPLISNLDIPLFEPASTVLVSSIKPSSSMKATVNGDQKCRTATMSRFIEYFELADSTKVTATTTASTTTTTSSSSSLSVPSYYNCSSSTIRSSHSTPAKKATKSLYLTKTSIRCNSNPNLSKKNTTEELDPTLVSDTSSSPRKAPKRSLSSAFHVLSGLLPTKSKRRLDNKHDVQDDSDDNDSDSLISSSSSSSSIRMAWQGTTWLDEMKTSTDFDSRQRLASIDRSQPWWTATAPLSNHNVCVNA